MTANLVDGKQIAKQLKEVHRRELIELAAKGVKPGLAVILVGDDPASSVYVNRKSKTCEQLGMHSEVRRLAEQTTETELLEHIRELNEDRAIHGILVQLPLPSHISEKAIINAIDPAKDVDGFHPVNVGNLMIGDDALLSCTPAGIIELIKRVDPNIAGKHAVIVGRSNIVGKPVAMLLLQEHATVTICHSRTQNMSELTRQADILVVATGKAQMIKQEDIKPGCIVIDVGINRQDDGKLVGDVHFDEVKEVAGHITPVPGGVGPMTIAMLMKNTIEAAKKQCL